jgi:hypothetical protein
VLPPAAWQLRERLSRAVEEVLAQRWAPLFTDPGLAGRVFSFDHSGELFESLAWAYPHLSDELQQRVRTRLREEWASHPPFSNAAWYDLRQGQPRELFWVPAEFRSRLGSDRQPHPFAGVYAAWLFGVRCGEEELVRDSWPKLRAAFEDFSQSGWRLDSTKGDQFANRYLASLLAVSRLAERAGESDVAQRATAKGEETTAALAAWWDRALKTGTLETFRGSGELDPFIGKGDGVWLAVAPHRHRLALFQDLTPEVAALMAAKAPDATAKLTGMIHRRYPTWWLTGEERQVHFGENFVDPPDFALSVFRAESWLVESFAPELVHYVDVPCCRADLYYIIKLSLVLEASTRRSAAK